MRKGRVGELEKNYKFSFTQTAIEMSLSRFMYNFRSQKEIWAEEINVEVAGI